MKNLISLGFKSSIFFFVMIVFGFVQVDLSLRTIHFLTPARGEGQDAPTSTSSTSAPNGAGLANQLQEMKAEIVKLTKDGNISNLMELFNDFESSHKMCVKNQSIATYACLENFSPHIQSTTAAVNLVASTMTATTKNTCSKFGEMMDLVNKGLTLFSAACGAGKSACVLGCSSAVKKLESLKSAVASVQPKSIGADPAQAAGELKAIQSAQTEFNKLAANELNEVDPAKKAMASKLSTCTGEYALILASAGVGLFTTISKMKEADNCEDQSDGTGVNCADPKQANTTVCVCEKNPRMAGCSNNLEKTDPSQVSVNTTPAATASVASVKPGLPLPSTSDGFSNAKPSSGDGSSLAPFGGDGGSDSGTGLGDGERAPATAKKAGGVQLNDGSAGGGGGRGFSGWGASYSDPAARAALYKADPAKAQALAATHQFKKEVTSGDGLSNWEKVSNRYKDNRHTLLIGK